MIKKITPLSMAEATEYIKEAEVKSFVKSFVKLSLKKAGEIREKLNSLDIIKLNEKNISKIIDILPKEKDELLKIMPDANLDENEANTILQTIKEYN